MEKISYSQIKKIYVLAKVIDNDILHIIVHDVTGKDSIKSLTCREAIKVIDELEYRINGVRPKRNYRENMATKEQIYKIKALEKELKWDNNHKRLKGFMKKFQKVENINWLTFKAASDLIEALKKVLNHETQKQLSN